MVVDWLVYVWKFVCLVVGGCLLIINYYSLLYVDRVLVVWLILLLLVSCLIGCLVGFCLMANIVFLVCIDFIVIYLLVGL